AAGAHEHEALAQARVLIRELHRNPATQRMPDDRRRLDPEQQQEIAHAVGVGCRRVVGAGLGGPPVPEQIRHDHPMIASEPIDDLGPGVAGVADAVDQQHGWALAHVEKRPPVAMHPGETNLMHPPHARRYGRHTCRTHPHERSLASGWRFPTHAREIRSRTTEPCRSRRRRVARGHSIVPAFAQVEPRRIVVATEHLNSKLRAMSDTPIAWDDRRGIATFARYQLDARHLLFEGWLPDALVPASEAWEA